jgi:hypothetical protein
LAGKHPGGRPTKYKPEYCQAVIDWMDKEPYTITDEGKKSPNDLPTFERFAHSIGVAKSTIYKWAETIPEFSDSLKKAGELQEDFWRANSLLGLYSPAFTIFAGKNMFGWRDKQDLDINDTRMAQAILGALSPEDADKVREAIKGSGKK